VVKPLPLEAKLAAFEEALSELVRSEVLFVRLIHQDLVTAGGKAHPPKARLPGLGGRWGCPL